MGTGLAEGNGPSRLGAGLGTGAGAYAGALVGVGTGAGTCPGALVGLGDGLATGLCELVWPVAAAALQPARASPAAPSIQMAVTRDRF